MQRVQIFIEGDGPLNVNINFKTAVENLANRIDI